jgi:hypothetical protein
MKRECDAWEPPSHLVSAQRLNQPGESLLYTSSDPHVAMEETKVVDGDIIPILVYEAIEPLMVVEIGTLPQDDGLSPEEMAKLKVITQFYRDEFTLEVGQGTEHLYKISEALAKKYFTLPSRFHDGWCYPSVARKGGTNVCFQPTSAKSKLSLIGFIVASVKVINGDFAFRPLVVAQGFNSNSHFVYHPLGSEAYTTLFSCLHRVR